MTTQTQTSKSRNGKSRNGKSTGERLDKTVLIMINIVIKTITVQRKTGKPNII